MEATSTAIRHWEDLVFENRNKDYGAYLLRKAYARRLMIGLGVTIVIVIVLLSIHDLQGDKEINPVVPPLAEGYDISPPPSIERPKPPRSTARHPRPARQNTQVLVTKDSVPETEVAQIADFVSPDGNETGGYGIPDGEGVIPVEVPVAPALPGFVDIAEVMPSYEGGLEAMMKFIQKKIRYPRAPIRQRIEGTVYVRFIVRGDGSVTDVSVIKGVHPDYDKEAVRVISLLPAWKGGSHNGRPVSVRMVLPIKFSLDNG